MKRMNFLGEAFLNGNQELISHFCLTQFGIVLPLSELISLMKLGKELVEKGFTWSWSDESYRLWIKNRVGDKLTCGCEYWINDISTATLHIFFISLEEDDLMLCRLRYAGEESIETKVPSSKIFDSASRVPTPINATTKRVARPPRGKSLLNN